MDDKRAWVAVIVSILFIAFYTETVLNPYLRPTHQQAQQTPNSSSSASNSSTGKSTSASPSAGAASSAQQTSSASAAQNSWKPSLLPRPTSGQIAAAPKITVSTDAYIAEISTLGGRLLSLKLKNYKLHQSGDELVDLVSSDADGILPGGIYIGDLNDGFVQYQYSAALGVEAHGGDTIEVALTGTINGDSVKKSFIFTGNSYLVNVSVATGGALAKQPSWLEWSRYLSAEASQARLNPVEIRVLSDENKITSTYSTKAADGVTPVMPAQWISIDEKYFLTSLLPTTQGPNGITIHETEPNGGYLLAARVSGAPESSTFSMFLGPKDSQILEDTGHQLYRNIDLGFFSFLAFPMLYLLRFFYSIVGNYGLAIILLTLMIKTLFLPLTMVSFRSARAMQSLQPEIKALRERITDPTLLNQEMLGLYKKRGVNPMGGCFPVLIQIPVFIGLYNSLLNAIDLRHARFALWIHDLSAPEQLLIFGFPVQLMVLVLGVSMFTQQVLTPAPGMDPAQRKMLLAMPLVLTCSFLMYPLPAGLVLYWIVNNTISITQQISIKSERKATPFQATLLAGSAFLLVGFLLTLI